MARLRSGDASTRNASRGTEGALCETRNRLSQPRGPQPPQPPPTPWTPRMGPAGLYMRLRRTLQLRLGAGGWFGCPSTCQWVGPGCGGASSPSAPLRNMPRWRRPPPGLTPPGEGAYRGGGHRAACRVGDRRGAAVDRRGAAVRQLHRRRPRCGCRSPSRPSRDFEREIAGNAALAADLSDCSRMPF